MAPPLERPDTARIGDAYRYTWPTTGVRVELDRLQENRDGLVAEATIARLVGAQPHLLHDARLNLLSTQTKAGLVRALEKQAQDVDWQNVVETFCFLAKRTFRDGDPALDLMAEPPPPRPRWLLKPYLEHAGPTTLFGPGGSGKTYLVDAMAVTLATGRSLLGFPSEPVKVLLLDYEADRATHYQRIQAVQLGHNRTEDLDGLIFYRSMSAPLYAAAPGLRRQVADLGIGVVFTDSLSLACGGDLKESSDVLRCFAAARSMGVPHLFIAHVTKEQVRSTEEGGSRRMSPFGTIYTENQSRNTWSVQRSGEEGDDEGHVALVHEKTNNGRFQKRHAYRVRFTPDPQDEDAVAAVEYRPVDLASVPAFSERVPLTDRLLAELRDGGKDLEALYAQVPDQPQNKIRATLSYLGKQGKVVRLDPRRYGLHYQGHPEAS